MQVQQLLKSASAKMAEAGIESAALEAELLLLDYLGVSRSRLFLIFDQQVDEETEKSFLELLSRRCKREPSQYILGSCEFWSLDFYVTPDVLIPRPETEFLLEHVLSVTGQNKNFYPDNFIDLCTGSGVIAVVLAREFSEASIYAADVSFKALSVAQKNFVRHGIDLRVHFMCSDLLTGFRQDHKFDVIVTNPPYVKSVDIPGLEPEVRDWEPERALSGGPSGLDIIKRICAQAVCHLTVGGWLFMEIGADIEEPVFRVFNSSERYDQLKIVHDWAGKPRVLQARFRG